LNEIIIGKNSARLQGDGYSIEEFELEREQNYYSEGNVSS